MIDSVSSISVSNLTKQIKNNLENNFQEVWVSGEISNFKHHYSGHMYFTLKDEGAEIRGVMFKGFNQYLRFKPEDGMSVLANGRISVYEQRGQYQIILKQLQPSGVGALYLAFEALKKQLSDEGLFDEERKLIFPKYPKTIGIITSKSGAAVQDIFQILERRAPFLNIVLRPTKVQGEGAAQDIVNAIEEINDIDIIDVIIMGRGGGSLEDLWPFNEEAVARAISASKIPVISAVGHETDFSISDMVADMRAPTPSAAAEIVSLSIDEILIKIDRKKIALESLIQNIIERKWQSTDDMINRHMRQQPQKVIEAQYKEYTQLENRLFNSATQFQNFQHLRTNPLIEKLMVLNPNSILDRGYSVAFKISDRKIIRKANDLNKDERFELLTSSGSLEARKISNKKY